MGALEGYKVMDMGRAEVDWAEGCLVVVDDKPDIEEDI